VPLLTGEKLMGFIGERVGNSDSREKELDVLAFGLANGLRLRSRSRSAGRAVSMAVARPSCGAVRGWEEVECRVEVILVDTPFE
jgi:hypothetical protein